MKPISGKVFCKLLHLHGWQLQRIRGSHHIYTHSGRPEILTVPVHGNQDSIAVKVEKTYEPRSLDRKPSATCVIASGQK
ncbi:MAG: type II toxin-antitoxin system HicA family toxin [Proteobacteria bacterium]|nr:type II toxin-antitoxin system HicA family toxin [Pseudomonadota bacterium]